MSGEPQRTIHRIWTGAPPPREYVRNADSWRAHGFEVREWDEDAILSLPLRNRALWDSAPSLVPSRIVPRFRSDVARYEILARFGGVYADHDFRCVCDPSPHIDGAEVFCVVEKPGLYANGFIGGEAGHPMWEALVEGAEESVRSQPKAQCWQTVGPLYFTRVAQRFPQVRALPTRLFLPYHHSRLDPDGRGVLPDDAVLDHTWGSARGQVSVVIPFRGGDAWRERALDAVVARYGSHDDWQVVVERDEAEGPWCKAAVVNAGVRRSFGDVLVIADADLLCDGVETAVDHCRRGRKWVMPYRMLYRMNESATDRVLAGESPSEVMTDRTLLADTKAPYPGVIGGGIVVLRREVYERVSMDERFVGWGGEDVSWGHALSTLAQRPLILKDNLYHLWHPPQPTRVTPNRGSEANHNLYKRYAAANRAPARMRALLREATSAHV